MNKISVQVNCKRTTVFNILIQNSLRKKGNSLSRSGRFSILNRVQKRNILYIIRINLKIIYIVLKFVIDVNVYINILSRMFKNKNIKN